MFLIDGVLFTFDLFANAFWKNVILGQVVRRASECWFSLLKRAGNATELQGSWLFLDFLDSFRNCGLT